MIQHEYCSIEIRKTDKEYYSDLVAYKYTPSGLVEIKSTGPHDNNSLTKNIDNFGNQLLTEGWSKIGFTAFSRPTTEANFDEIYEYCVVELDSNTVKGSGFFSKEKKTYRHTAYKLSPQELVPIETSPLYDNLVDSLYHDLKDRLMNNNWEVMNGQTDIFIRKIDNQESADSETQSNFTQQKDPIVLLKQLAELRDSGVLTEEEFEKKKSEILDKM
ncbi:SHOCT domain-containing protein [Pontibacter populi]|uniref:SHOCT domain-containing protein n=1 Tax=Pontibacter populi TaxID=890055 RepID=A0ABV1RVN2_9BACT